MALTECFKEDRSVKELIVYNLDESKTIVEEMDIDKSETGKIELILNEEEIEEEENGLRGINDHRRTDDNVSDSTRDKDRKSGSKNVGDIIGEEEDDEEEDMSNRRKKRRHTVGYNYSEECGEGMGYTSFIEPGPYNCILCPDVICSNANHYLAHMQQDHTIEKEDRQYLTCNKCNKEMIVHKTCKNGPGKDTLYRQAFIRLCQHVISYHDQQLPTYLKLYTCRLCGYETVVRPNFRKHSDYCKRQSGQNSVQQLVTVNKAAKALIQEKTGMKKSDSYAGPIFDLNAVNFPCFLCKEVYKSEDNLFDHILEKHSEETDTKPRSAKTKSITCYKFKCTWANCTQSYTSRTVTASIKESVSKLLSHCIKLHHIEMPEYARVYECDICRERVLLQMSKQHVQKHLADTTLVMCDGCAAFIKPSLLEKHKEKCNASAEIQDDLFDIRESESDTDDEQLLRKEEHQVVYVKGVFIDQGPFQCFVCLEEHQSLNLFIQHFEKEHYNNRKLDCLQCNYSINVPKETNKGPAYSSLFKQSIASLLNHYVIKHDRLVPTYAKVYRCSHCSYVTLSRASWRKHHMTSHANKSDFLTELKRQSENLADTLTKKSSIFLNMTIRCFFCDDDNSFVGHENDVLEHILRTHTARVDEETFVIGCPHCDRLFSTKPYLEDLRLSVARFLAHVTGSHSFSLPKSCLNFYECNSCDYQTIVYTAMKRHTVRHCFAAQCDQCSQWVRASEIANHKRKHNSAKSAAAVAAAASSSVSNDSVICPLCNKRYPNQDAVKVHQRRMHEGKRNYECTNCGASFFGKAEWLGHMWVRHKINASGRPPLTCDVCQYKTVIRDLMNKHKKHHDFGQFKCGYCDRVLNTKAQYEVHIRRNHPQNNAGNNQSIKCTICNYTTSDRTKLHRHVQHSHPNVQFQCRYCTFRHVDQDSVVKHESRMHKILQQPVDQQLFATEMAPSVFDIDREQDAINQQNVILFQPGDGVGEIVLDESEAPNNQVLNFEQVIIEGNFP